MLKYTNTFLGLTITIPSEWKVVSWRHAKLDPLRHAEYQCRDDDLPREVDVCKVLFNASLYTPGSNIYLDAEIEPSIYRKAADDDFRRSLLENHRRLMPFFEKYGIKTAVTGEGFWTLGGRDFRYVDQESRSSNGHSRYRFIYRPIDTALWLYGKIAGHKEWAYREAINVMESLDWQGGTQSV